MTPCLIIYLSTSLQALRLLDSFTDNLKLINKTTLIKSNAVQHGVDCAYNKSLDNELSISLDKSSVMYLDAKNICCSSTCCDYVPLIVIAYINISVLHTVNDS